MMNNPNQPKIVRLDVSFGTLFKITIYALALYIVGKAFSLFILAYVALILASAFRPIVNYAKYLKIPRSIAVFLIYLAIIGSIIGAFSLILPPIVQQTRDFIVNIPSLAEQLAMRYGWFADLLRKFDLRAILINFSDSIINWSTNLSSGVLTNAWSITSGFFGGILGVFLVLVLAFYMIVGEQRLINNIASLVPAQRKNLIIDLIGSIQSKLGDWFRGQLTLMLAVGIASFVGYTLIGTKYALPLALIAGLLEIVPYLGPSLTTVIAFFVVLPSSFLMAIGALLVGIIIQQAENNILTPLIMRQAVGLDPLFVLISLGIGSRILGIGGTILAVPLVATIQIVIQFYAKYEKQSKEDLVENLCFISEVVAPGGIEPPFPP